MSDDVVRMSYSLKEVSHGNDAALGKRKVSCVKVEPKEGRKTPDLKKEGYIDEDYMSLFDNAENTNGLSIFANMKNENSMFSVVLPPHLAGADAENSMPMQDDKAKKARMTQARNISQGLHDYENDNNARINPFFSAISRADENSRGPVMLTQTMNNRDDSMRLEATPSGSEAEDEKSRLSYQRREEAKQVSTSEISFELNVQRMKERLDKFGKEKQTSHAKN